MKESDFSLGPIMKAARKFKKFNQADVANAIGCSQSALSKMEHNLLIPSAPQWFLFSRFTSIPPESLENGVIDRKMKIKFNSDDVSLGFKIPKKYRSQRSEKVREIYPFMQYLEKHMGTEIVTEYLNFTGLDPEFFLDFDNLINFQLMADTIHFFVRYGKNTPEIIKEIVSTGQNKYYWDNFEVEWKKLDSPKSVLTEYAAEQAFFQADFQLNLEDTGGGRLVLSYVPEFHLKQFKENDDLLIDFLNEYRRATIEGLLTTLGMSPHVSIVPTEKTSLGGKLEIT